MRGFEGEYVSWVELAADSLRHRRPGLSHETVARLGRTFDSPAGEAWIERDGRLRLRLWHRHPERPAGALRDRWRGLSARDHPVATRFLETGDSTPTTLARTLRSGGTESAAAFRWAAGAPELEHELWIPVRCSTTEHRSFVLARHSADFSDDELALARRLQPLVMLLDQKDPARPGAELPVDLTDRELTVLRLLAEGETAAGIGRRLGISPRTVQKHLEHLYRKLGVGDRLLAVRAAIAAGLVAEPTTQDAPRS